jgi:hypothetical protein
MHPGVCTPAQHRGGEFSRCQRQLAKDPGALKPHAPLINSSALRGAKPFAQHFSIQTSSADRWPRKLSLPGPLCPGGALRIASQL